MEAPIQGLLYRGSYVEAPARSLSYAEAPKRFYGSSHIEAPRPWHVNYNSFMGGPTQQLLYRGHT